MGFYRGKAKPFRRFPAPAEPGVKQNIVMLTNTEEGDHGEAGDNVTWACDATELLSILDAETKSGRDRGKRRCQALASETKVWF